MSSLQHSNTYEIQFSGLAHGNHSFEWDIEPEFFNKYGNEEILESKLTATIDLEKRAIHEAFFHIEGQVKTLCDRCGDEVWIDVETDDELLARFGSETDMNNDEVIFLDSSEYKLEVGQFFYEFGYLAIPQKRTHEEGECATEYEDFFEERTDDNQAIDNNDHIDPRWEALKKLK